MTTNIMNLSINPATKDSTVIRRIGAQFNGYKLTHEGYYKAVADFVSSTKGKDITATPLYNDAIVTYLPYKSYKVTSAEDNVFHLYQNLAPISNELNQKFSDIPILTWEPMSFLQSKLATYRTELTIDLGDTEALRKGDGVYIHCFELIFRWAEKMLEQQEIQEKIVFLYNHERIDDATREKREDKLVLTFIKSESDNLLTLNELIRDVEVIADMVFSGLTKEQCDNISLRAIVSAE